ncbi:MAG: hypothetical protein U0804_18025 [Gemmataceae bacterium]
MSDAAATLLEQALALPEVDRRWLADQLDATLPPNAEERAYWDEIARRSDEAHAHPDRLIPWDVARAQMRAELDRRRAARARGEVS